MTSAALVFIATMGLALGSFLNVVIARLPTDWRLSALVWPASQCPHCQSTIGWLEKLPVLGWLICQGHCRACQQPIRLRYVLIEAGSALVAVLVINQFGLTPAGLSALVLSAWLIVLSGIDQDTLLLPDCLTLSGLWLGLLSATLYHHTTPIEAITGAALGYSVLAGLNAGYYWLTGREGMGGGDFKLLAMLGAWLGVSALPAILLLAAGGGTLWALGGMLWARRSRYAMMAFGPWLAAAGWITLIWGHEWQKIIG